MDRPARKRRAAGYHANELESDSDSLGGNWAKDGDLGKRNRERVDHDADLGGDDGFAVRHGAVAVGVSHSLGWYRVQAGDDDVDDMDDLDDEPVVRWRHAP